VEHFTRQDLTRLAQDRLAEVSDLALGIGLALEALAATGQTPAEFLARHLAGDWGDLCPEDRRLNDQALREGSRLLSAYRTARGVKLWVITEANRSSTCLLLPEEY
jgi:hypothetical protein